MKKSHRIAAGGVAATMLIGVAGVAPALAGSTNASTNWQLADGTAHPSDTTQLASVDFTVPNKTHLLFNDKDQMLLGNHDGKTITADATIAGVNGQFTYSGQGTTSNPCGTPANVRLYFESTPPGAKFAYTNYWWSNPVSATLTNGAVHLSTTLDSTNWSDWNGQPGTTQQTGFDTAARNITSVGLSFGGGCFFENGVGTSDGSGTFFLTNFTDN